MKPKPFLFTKRFPIPSPFSFSPRRCFTRSVAHSSSDAAPATSAVYRHALKFQSPATIQWAPHLANSASFIGSVTGPERVNSKSDNLGVYALLNVPSSNQPNNGSFFRVLLMMRKSVAEVALEHLKPNDFICVSGRLESFTKLDDSGKPQIRYKLEVKEFEFVAQRPSCQEVKKLESAEEMKNLSSPPIPFKAPLLNNLVASAADKETAMQNVQNRLHLWQVYFANPSEWWDHRKRKLHQNQPDFKHKDTGEALWLRDGDPPWVKRQLQLLDSKMAEGRFVGRRTRVSTWDYDE